MPSNVFRLSWNSRFSPKIQIPREFGESDIGAAIDRASPRYQPVSSPASTRSIIQPDQSCAGLFEAALMVKLIKVRLKINV
jgi:hypothetical protein